MRGNAVEDETARDSLNSAVAKIRQLLPQQWDVMLSLETALPAPSRGPHCNASMVIRASDGSAATFLVEVKTGSSVGMDRAVERLKQQAEETGSSALLVAPFIGPALRQRCEENDVSYLDLTGWCWIHTSSPAVAIRSIGASRDPGPPRKSIITRLNGSGAGRIVRELLEGELPVGVRTLARRVAVSPGTVSKVVKELAYETIVTRNDSGEILAVRKRHLVDRWTRDYSFLRTNNVGWYLAPRGLTYLTERIMESGSWAVGTGSLATRRLLPDNQVPVTALAQLALYVPRLTAATAILKLVPTERATANVILAEPYDVQLLKAQKGVDPIAVVDTGQALADLKTMPGRAPQEAEQLMELLAETDLSWR
jgi:hypothetical protein